MFYPNGEPYVDEVLNEEIKCCMIKQHYSFMRINLRFVALFVG